MLTTVAMATDKHATMGAAVFSLGSVPVMTSCNRRGPETVFSLWSVHGLYSSGSYENTSYESVFGPSSSLQRRVAELQANGSCNIGRQATSVKTRQVL
jgi:hypothetical protein